MEPLSAFRNEFFSRVTTIFLPGAFAVGPYVLVLNFYVHGIELFWVKYPSAFVSILLIVIITVGRILENLGSVIEARFWDEWLDSKNPDHLENWYRYLRLRMKDEIVGQRYLSTVVIRMKFELSMGPALVLFLGGLVWLNCLESFWCAETLTLVSTGIVELAIYLLWESYDSAVLCANTRKLILEALSDDSNVQSIIIAA